jgi:hypothetical protein
MTSVDLWCRRLTASPPGVLARHADDAAAFAGSACVLLPRGHYILACAEFCVEMRLCPRSVRRTVFDAWKWANLDVVVNSGFYTFFEISMR